VVELLLAEDHEVIAVVHNHDIFQGHPHLHVRALDIHDAGAVADVLEGTDAVISTLSSWGSKEGDVLSTAMGAIVPVMQKLGIKRIVSLTGNAAFTDEDEPTTAQKASRSMLMKVGKKVVLDGEEHMRILKDSGLDWTVIRSPLMNTMGEPTYKLSLELSGATATINRQAVARALVAQLHDGTWLRQAPVIWRA